jgi:hypothetical protein
VAQTTFEEISAADYVSLYNQGYSINELAKIMGCSYAHVRSVLLKNGATLRTRKEAFINMVSRHPEWRKQFLKYAIPSESRQLSSSKIKLLFLLYTEGCIWKNKVQFTNNQAILRDLFSTLMKEVYNVNTKTYGNVTNIHSINIANDLRTYNIKEAIPKEVMYKLLQSPQLTKEVLRIFADTEGSVIISIRNAPRNYTVGDRRIVIACTNAIVKSQLITLLKSLRITGRQGKDGVLIANERSLREFAQQISFSSGIKVIRKKAGHGVWYMYEKATLVRLLIRIYDEQIKKGRGGKHLGVFRNCKNKKGVMKILNSWYNELKGG